MGNGRSGGPDRQDLLFRAGAVLAAVVPLWLVVLLVIHRTQSLGVIALVSGMILGLAMVFAVPDGAAGTVTRSRHAPTQERSAHRTPTAPLSKPDGRPTGSPGPSAPSTLPSPGTYPVGSTGRPRAADGFAHGPGAAPGWIPGGGVTTVAERLQTASEGGYVLGPGSRAGQSPWRLPLSSGQPGIAVDAARVGDLEVRAASVIGPAHRCDEPAVARQDAYVLARDRRCEHLVIAVADGVSASPSSELGARVAVSTAARELTAVLDQLHDPTSVDVGGLFTTVAREMTGTGRGRGLSERDLCCVLVVAVIPAAPAADGSRQVWTAQLGDVSLWTHGPEWAQRTGHAKSGLDRNELHDVLPFHPGVATPGWFTLPPGYGVAVLTDGVGDLLADVPDAAAFLAERWVAPPNPAEFLATLCLDAPGQDDDRTAVVVWTGAGAPTPRPPR